MDKKKIIEFHFKEIMHALGLDMSDDSLEGTPKRVAKMFVDELFCGLDENNFPSMTTQDNKFNYSQMLTEVNIDVRSVCEHHFVPIIGVAHVSYIPGKKLIGLSKLNRVTEYYSRRPQVQERLTENIKDKLIEVLGTEDVAVTIDAVHYCVKMRGVKHSNCITRTTGLGGMFKDEQVVRSEYFNSIPRITNA